MCGRYGVTVDAETIAEIFGVGRVVGDHRPRWNVAPGQEAPVIVSAGGGRQMGPVRWGFVPASMDDPKQAGWINARSETVHTSRAFSEAFRRHRCLVPATGFYEWERVDGGPNLPWWFSLPDEQPFAFAGIWDRWRGGGEERTTFAILTSEPSETVEPIHDRMPVVLTGESADRWLDSGAAREELRSLLRPFGGPLEKRPVSTRVNDAGAEGPECLEPRGDAAAPDR